MDVKDLTLAHVKSHLQVLPFKKKIQMRSEEKPFTIFLSSIFLSSSSPGPSSSVPSTQPPTTLSIEDEDALFLRNQTRDARAWKELSKITEGASFAYLDFEHA